MSLTLTKKQFRLCQHELLSLVHAENGLAKYVYADFLAADELGFRRGVGEILPGGPTITITPRMADVLGGVIHAAVERYATDAELAKEFLTIAIHLGVDR